MTANTTERLVSQHLSTLAVSFSELQASCWMIPPAFPKKTTELLCLPLFSWHLFLSTTFPLNLNPCSELFHISNSKTIFPICSQIFEVVVRRIKTMGWLAWFFIQENNRKDGNTWHYSMFKFRLICLIQMPVVFIMLCLSFPLNCVMIF